MHKIQIIGFLFANRVHCLFEVEKKFLQTTVLGRIFIYVQMKHTYIILYMYVTNGEKN
jgi:hypothetical protein